MKLKVKKSIETYYYIIFLSLFICGNVIRRSFFSGFFGTGNLIYYLLLFILILEIDIPLKLLSIFKFCIPGLNSNSVRLANDLNPCNSIFFKYISLCSSYDYDPQGNYGADAGIL